MVAVPGNPRHKGRPAHAAHGHGHPLRKRTARPFHGIEPVRPVLDPSRRHGRAALGGLNFFHNDFDERLGKALFTGDSSRIGDVNTPDVTSAGDLPKRWIIRDDGVRTLIKAGRSGQEPDNERIAWKTARLLGIDHVEYRVGRINGARVSACDEMLSDTEELIPAGQIMRIFRKEDTGNGATSGWRPANARRRP